MVSMMEEGHFMKEMELIMMEIFQRDKNMNFENYII